jgi:hypothetical protein
MNAPQGPQLLELARRRPLTPAERAALDAWLAQHPEARPADWAEELALTRLLAALPPAPLSPRFVENTLAALDRREGKPAASWASAWRRWLAGFQPAWRWAGVAVLLAAMLGGWQFQQHRREQARLAESILAVSTLAGDLPDAAALAEFDVVLHLPDGPLPDLEALARALE